MNTAGNLEIPAKAAHERALDPTRIGCIVFDFSGTLCPDQYFRTCPTGVPEWHNLFRKEIFSGSGTLTEWCRGQITKYDIARIMTPHLHMEIDDIVAGMEEGCRGLVLTETLLAFAAAQRTAGRKTALVTVNADLFTEVVVAAHGLDRVFDVIVNSADYMIDDKTILWRVAFARLGEPVHFATSLLIDDSDKWATEFESRGGFAHKYRGEEEFAEWLGHAGLEQPANVSGKN